MTNPERTGNFLTRYYAKEPELSIIGVVAFVIVIAFIVLIWFANQSDNEWHQWSIDHHCVLISTTNGQAFNTVAPNSSGGVSIGTGYIPGQNSYKCDDGVVHYK